MLTYGIILAVIGAIIWAVGVSIPHPALVIVGKVVTGIGALLLIFALILLVIPAGGVPIDSALVLVR